MYGNKTVLSGGLKEENLGFRANRLDEHGTYIGETRNDYKNPFVKWLKLVALIRCGRVSQQGAGNLLKIF